MTINMGTTDRGIRLIAGLLLLGTPLLAALLGTPLGTAVSYGSIFIGLVLTATAFLRFCPLYRVLGLSTVRKEHHGN